MQWICDRTLHRFVVFRKWSIREGRKRSEDSADALLVHDERTHVIARFRIDFEVGNIITDPFLLRIAPPNLSAFSIPGLARWITGGAVVHDATIGGPGPGPILIDAKT